jgi:hypothetical protein
MPPVAGHDHGVAGEQADHVVYRAGLIGSEAEADRAI